MTILQRLHRKNQSESVLESPDMRPLERASVQLYLASNSPRRKELLSLVGLEYTLLPAPVDETPYPGEGGADYVIRVARSKAQAAACRVDREGIVIAADTAVVATELVDRETGVQEKILGKPAGQEEAFAMLRSLRGRTHQVHTAVAILPVPGGKTASDLCTTDVPMREYTDSEIEAYVASGDPLDKAGAYAIQHPVFDPVSRVEGCSLNVVGLPLCHLGRALAAFGVVVPANIPRACRAFTQRDCAVPVEMLTKGR